MPSFFVATASYRSNSEDRLVVLDAGQAWILVLADGTGGASGGSSAAEMFVQGIQRASVQAAFDVRSPAAWVALLAELDDEIRRAPRAGETTGIALAVTQTAIVGASCGDSEAWLFAANTREQLTSNQVRKPRLGSGRAEPRSFQAAARGVLLVASDGLFGHAKLDDVVATVLAESADPATALVQLLERRHRKLPDDVAIIVGQLG